MARGDERLVREPFVLKHDLTLRAEAARLARLVALLDDPALGPGDELMLRTAIERAANAALQAAVCGQRRTAIAVERAALGRYG